MYAIKGRPPGLELGLLAASMSELDGLVEMGAVARALAGAFWPGPLSLVCPVGARRLAVPRYGATLMVRVPAHLFLRGLLEATGPVASTSANRQGAPPARSAAEARAGPGGGHRRHGGRGSQHRNALDYHRPVVEASANAAGGADPVDRAPSAHRRCNPRTGGNWT